VYYKFIGTLLQNLNHNLKTGTKLFYQILRIFKKESLLTTFLSSRTVSYRYKVVLSNFTNGNTGYKPQEKAAPIVYLVDDDLFAALKQRESK
jgi:hypothetical protein